jgi:hypothetical protein
MKDRNIKYISQLVNSHKLSAILIPLIEAVEINKRNGVIDNLHPKDLLKHVIEVGGELYQELLDDNSDIAETGLVADKLFLTLAKALRNSIVLYNSPSLSLMKDEISNMFDENINFIQSYQNTNEKLLYGESGERLSAREKSDRKQYAMGYSLSALSQMFMPIWLFHTNLYTSGLIDEEGIVELNSEVSSYMVLVLKTLMEKMKTSHGENSEEFEVNSLFLCAEMCSNVLYDYHGKLIKNKANLEQYILDPKVVLSKIVPALYANFATLNDALFTTMKEILSE